jgi:hypothetical protein
MKPTTTARPFWALRVVSALLLCLLGWAKPPPLPSRQGAPARPAAFAQSELGVAPARLPGPSLERAAQGPHPGPHEFGDQGGLGPYLPAPHELALAGPGYRSLLTTNLASRLVGRRLLWRPVARGPPGALAGC